MERLLENINAYINYLNKRCKLNTSIHFSGDRLEHIPLQYLPILLKYNSHTNPYCMDVKNSAEMKTKCMLSQKNILDSHTQTGFCRKCHAGVCEFVGPIFENGNMVGFVAVSGYKEEKDIPVELCEILIPPLCSMVEQFFAKCIENSGSEYNLMVQYLNEYHTNTTLDEVSKYLGKSMSSVSHMFKRTSGMSVREYCNHLKLEDARRILLNTDKSVTEITYDVGFSDVSYFVHLFKNKYGVSPLRYRKNQCK